MEVLILKHVSIKKVKKHKNVKMKMKFLLNLWCVSIDISMQQQSPCSTVISLTCGIYCYTFLLCRFEGFGESATTIITVTCIKSLTGLRVTKWSECQVSLFSYCYTLLSWHVLKLNPPKRALKYMQLYAMLILHVPGNSILTADDL